MGLHALSTASLKRHKRTAEEYLAAIEQELAIRETKQPKARRKLTEEHSRIAKRVRGKFKKLRDDVLELGA